jgi:hypothetical protein
MQDSRGQKASVKQNFIDAQIPMEETFGEGQQAHPSNRTAQNLSRAESNARGGRFAWA